MVKVHHYKVLNSSHGNWEFPPSKRTAESIAKLKGEIIPDTEEEIHVTQLDSLGRYFPRGAVPKDEQ